MSDFRSVMITGDAVADYVGGKRKKRGVTKKKQFGGTNLMVAPTAIAPNATNATNATATTAPTATAPTATATAPTATTATTATPPTTGGAVKRIKVELKKKQASHKVKLQPKSDKKIKKGKSHKNRKFSLGISSLHKRITRAKSLHKKVKNMPIDKLKEILIAKKLIKPTSKAPESVLRQIASDINIVDKNAL